MKLNDNKSKRTRSGLWIIVVAAVILEATACIQYFYTRSALQKEAEKSARIELKRAEQEIEKHTVEMETAAKMLAMLAEQHVSHPDSAQYATSAIVRTIRNTGSVAVAYVPGYFKGERLSVSGEQIGEYFEVCSSRITEDSIYTRQIGSAQHDYTQMEWFQNGLNTDSCTWCEPYLDDSGSQTWVVSCSCPVHDHSGKIVAVVCVDMSLDYLQQISDFLYVYKESYCSIRSASGLDIVTPPDTTAGRKYETFDEDIDATGWKMSIIIPAEVIYAELKRVGLLVTILMIIGMMVLVFIISRAAKSLTNLINLSNQQERIESELNIARSIQMAMLPTRFPPFPDFPNLSAFGEVIPAKEVGGDLIDFHIRDRKLFFCIGDVSGKGVPAALVMAVTRSLFRSFTSYINSPAQIVQEMNERLSSESNQQNMFVTMFVGALDLTTGDLRYCNAGHDAPILLPVEHLLSDQVPNTLLPCDANLPLGVLPGFAFSEQSAKMEEGETLFLYTDGLTEAENSAHEQFGLERIQEQLASGSEVAATPRERIVAMQQAVANFVRGAEQSDDLTMFAVQLLERTEKQETKNKEQGTMNKEQETKNKGVGKHFSLVMRNDIQQIPTLAEWIDMIGLPDELNMSINLALEEAVSNVMLYAYPDTNSGRVLVEAEKTADRVTFIISDSGVAFDPTKQKEADITLSVEERAIGGLGIHLVRQLMDDIHYERKDEKNVLTLVKMLNC